MFLLISIQFSSGGVAISYDENEDKEMGINFMDIPKEAYVF